VANGLRGNFGREDIAPLENRRQPPRQTTSKHLPDILPLKGRGLSQAEVGQRTGLLNRPVERCLRRWRQQVIKERLGFAVKARREELSLSQRVGRPRRDPPHLPQRLRAGRAERELGRL